MTCFRHLFLLKETCLSSKMGIERRNKQVALRKQRVNFEYGELVRIHMRKLRFPSNRKSKLHLRDDGSFKVLERIGDDVYELNLPDEVLSKCYFHVAGLVQFFSRKGWCYRSCKKTIINVSR